MLRGKVSWILKKATDHNETRHFPVLSTFGALRTCNWNIRLLALDVWAEADWARVEMTGLVHCPDMT